MAARRAPHLYKRAPYWPFLQGALGKTLHATPNILEEIELQGFHHGLTLPPPGTTRSGQVQEEEKHGMGTAPVVEADTIEDIERKKDEAVKYSYVVNGVIDGERLATSRHLHWLAHSADLSDRSLSRKAEMIAKMEVAFESKRPTLIVRIIRDLKASLSGGMQRAANVVDENLEVKAWRRYLREMCILKGIPTLSEDLSSQVEAAPSSSRA
ncbi:hypothetical protein CBS101457_003306 [Exobasidium rhododendri]|nr:hypothetical protein CBS101457_003306 [Exobasidium rhododendri]